MNYETPAHVDLHVIDAIDEASFNRGNSDAAMLRDALRETNLNIVNHVARDLDSLKATITQIISHRQTYSYPRNSTPYVHISCHGTKDDLLLGDATTMPWAVLSETLLPLQEVTDYHMPLSISSCWGYHGAKLAYVMDESYQKRRPYYSLVGPPEKEDIRPLADAFGHFYRHLLVDFKSLKESIAL